MLILNGHNEKEIGDYPLDKFKVYVESVHRLESGRRYFYVSDTLNAIAGVFSKGDATKKHMASLMNNSGV